MSTSFFIKDFLFITSVWHASSPHLAQFQTYSLFWNFVYNFLTCSLFCGITWFTWTFFAHYSFIIVTVQKLLYFFVTIFSSSIICYPSYSLRIFHFAVWFTIIYCKGSHARSHLILFTWFSCYFFRACWVPLGVE